MTTTNEKQQVALTIVNQLAGADNGMNGLKCMMNARNFAHGKDSVQFNFSEFQRIRQGPDQPEWGRPVRLHLRSQGQAKGAVRDRECG